MSATSAGERKAKDLQLPRLHAHLPEDQESEVPPDTANDAGADAHQAQEAQERADAEAPSSYPGIREVVGPSRARLLRLPTRSPPTSERCKPSERRPSGAGASRSRGVASEAARTGRGCARCRNSGSHRRGSCIPCRSIASTLVPESRAECVGSACSDLCGGPSREL